jgi:hypothetical protein
MINMEEIVRHLTANAKAMCALAQNLSDEDASWKPTPETWSMQEVIEHIYNEERLDFRNHLKKMLNGPPLKWGGGDSDAYLSVNGCRKTLESFLTERQASIAWLMVLKSPDWRVTFQMSFGAAGDVMTISAGDVLVSWVAHDYLHLRQMNELLYALNEKQASPNSVAYAGGW